MIIRRIWPLAYNHLEDLASCKWSSGGSGLLHMIIRRIKPLANDHLPSANDHPPLANDHPEGPASCKWSSGGSGLLHMIIRRIKPLANDHPQEPTSWKLSLWIIFCKCFLIRIIFFANRTSGELRCYACVIHTCEMDAVFNIKQNSQLDSFANLWINQEGLGIVHAHQVPSIVFFTISFTRLIGWLLHEQANRDCHC